MCSIKKIILKYKHVGQFIRKVLKVQGLFTGAVKISRVGDSHTNKVNDISPKNTNNNPNKQSAENEHKIEKFTRKIPPRIFGQFVCHVVKSKQTITCPRFSTSASILRKQKRLSEASAIERTPAWETSEIFTVHGTCRRCDRIKMHDRQKRNEKRFV